jgi:hypothetical protein
MTGTKHQISKILVLQHLMAYLQECIKDKGRYPLKINIIFLWGLGFMLHQHSTSHMATPALLVERD